ncbi:MAG: peptidoglycan DD-metalloendopeptidase family protein [Elusimicrobia bacterium]|nr:peptidoglycan DD-metalloendopeptidase family protein [Elusimicrobiota bacterium]
MRFLLFTLRFSLFLFLAVSVAQKLQAQVSLSQKSQELSEVRKQLDSKTQEIEALRQEERKLNRELSGLESGLSGYRQKLNQLKKELSAAENKKRELESRRFGLQFAVVQWREALLEELRDWVGFSHSEFPYFGLSDIWLSVYREATLQRHVSFMSSLNGSWDHTESMTKEASKTSAKIQGMTAQVLQEHRTKEEIYLKNKSVLEEVELRRRRALEEVIKIKKSAQALTDLVNQLKKTVPSHSLGARVLSIPVHSLPWPVEGQIVGRFGNEKVPDLGVSLVREGLRLKTSPHALVRPVRSGKVLYAGNFRSYGEVIILEHSEGFFSIYGGLGEVSVRRGALLRRNDVLGKVSGDGLLHLELRNGSLAVDPLTYLMPLEKIAKAGE